MTSLEELRFRHERLRFSLQAKDGPSILLVPSGKFVPETLTEYQEKPNFYYLSGLWSPDLVYGLVIPPVGDKREVREFIILGEPSASKQAKSFYNTFFSQSYLPFSSSSSSSSSSFSSSTSTSTSSPDSQLQVELVRNFGDECNWPSWTFLQNLGRLAFLRKKEIGTVLTSSVAQLVQKMNRSSVHWWFAPTRADEKSVPSQWALPDGVARTFRSAWKKLALLRMSKSPAEQKLIRKATELSCRLHDAVRTGIISGGGSGFKGLKVREGSDLEIEAFATSMFRGQAATHSYFPIVLTNGPASKYLHGHASGDKLSSPGVSTVLLDVGARVQGYCSDISRTWLLTPTAEEQKIHAFLVRSMEYLEKSVLAPGKWIRESRAIDRPSIGGEYAQWIKKTFPSASYSALYLVHSIGHHVGLEVHDPELRPLQEGDCFAIEVGHYNPIKRIGMRIEDMYTISGGKAVRLSAQLRRTM